MEEVILVNRSDEPIGRMEKQKAHEQGLLHRAFSICLFDSSHRWLLQKRAASKYHSQRKWANSCCSHPRPVETLKEAVKRRLFDELRITTELFPIGSFIYRAEVGNGLIEHELDHIFVGRFDGEISFNNEEIEEVRWWTREEIEKALKEEPSLFAPWFPLLFSNKSLTAYSRRAA